jgi:hypothetical protein
VFEDGDTVRLVKQRDAECRVLAETVFDYRHDTPYHCELRCVGDRLSLRVDGRPVLAARDEDRHYRSGGAGFLADTGTVLADGFVIRALDNGAAR